MSADGQQAENDFSLEHCTICGSKPGELCKAYDPEAVCPWYASDEWEDDFDDEDFDEEEDEF
ncbi:MAG: hypothetical protein JRN67_05945 [Nitrososphaerota archaeon]|nr:hypothetical protein [Nitrososphaerota archaeon]